MIDELMKAQSRACLKLFYPALTATLLLLSAATVNAAANDPSGGACDGLDPSSGLFSKCIQAHSAKNRVEHLASRNASSNAIAVAQSQLDQAIAEYAELGGGGVPGLQSCACWSSVQLAALSFDFCSDSLPYNGIYVIGRDVEARVSSLETKGDPTCYFNDGNTVVTEVLGTGQDYSACADQLAALSVCNP